MRKTTMMAIALATACAYAGETPQDFHWELNQSGRTETLVPAGLPPQGTYSVRFRAALVNARGGQFRVVADGVGFASHGDGFDLDSTGESHVVPGQLNEKDFDFHLRNRCFHDFFFVCSADRIVLFGDGDEKRPVLKATDSARGFKIIGEKVDVWIKDLEVASGDMSGIWSSRNLMINGGVEELSNGYPPYWTTQNFGFCTDTLIADLDKAESQYHVDSTVAYEGRHSMFINTWIPFIECWRQRPRGPYVFSIYAKAQKAGAKMEMFAYSGYRTITNRFVRLTTDWQRFEMPFDSAYASFRCGVRSHAAHPVTGEWDNGIWVDAGQVEHGRAATAFVTREMPRTNEVPPHPPKIMDRYYSAIEPQPQKNRHAPRMARVDPKRNSFRFGDREFFMFGFTSMGMNDSPAWLKAMDQFAAWGMNVNGVTPGGRRLQDPAVLRRLLDESEKRGIKTKFYIDYDVKNDRLNEGQLNVIRAVADHPNILMVDILDEMYDRVKPEKRRAIVDRLRDELGGKVPIAVNEFDLGVLMHSDFSMCDVASGDFYVPGTHEMSAQYYILKTLRDENPDQVVYYYGMAAGHFSIWPKDATPEEVLAQAYNGYVLEVFNVLWWQAVPHSRPAREAVVQAKRERDLIDPSAFLDGAPARVTCESRNDAVKFTARKLKNGVTRIIALNIENRRNEARWTLPEPAKCIHPLIGNGPDKIVSETQFADRFGPLERRVYDVSPWGT